MRSTLRIEDPELKARLREALRPSYFATYDQNFLKTEAGEADVEAHVAGRYNACLDHILPWIERHIDLRGKHVVEVGVGTGASTAAFARVAERVTGYDIHGPSVEAAKARMEVLGLANTECQLIEPAELVPRLRRDHPEGADVFLLYAVLEHQTIAERLETIRAGWDLVRPGGLFVVIETPNRLTYWDEHTSQLPFFHLLHPQLAVRYAARSPRAPFRDSMERVKDQPEAADLALTRWGVGVSHHEFELALGDLHPLLVAHGFEQEITSWFPIQLDEELLRHFVQQSRLDVPPAFTRRVLNLILKKPDGGLTSPPGPVEVPPAGFLTPPAAEPSDELQRLRAEVSELREALARLGRWRPVDDRLRRSPLLEATTRKAAAVARRIAARLKAR